MGYRDDRDRVIYILFACGAGVLVIWRFVAHAHTVWPDFFLQAYLLTGGLFGVLLVGSYPNIGSRWFWKSMIPIFTMHAAILAGLLKITVETAPLDLRLPARMVYGFIGVACVLEWWLCLQIISVFRPKEE